jgi:hypothetical protein
MVNRFEDISTERYIVLFEYMNIQIDDGKRFHDIKGDGRRDPDKNIAIFDERGAVRMHDSPIHR